MGTVAVLALILKGLVDQRMVKEGLVLLYPGLHTMLRLQLLLYSDNRKGHGIGAQAVATAVAFCDPEVMAGYPISRPYTRIVQLIWRTRKKIFLL